MPLLILFILKGTPFLFACLILFLTYMGLTEFYRMALPERKIEGFAAAAAGTLLPLALFSSDRFMLLFAITLFVLIFSLLLLFRIREIRQATQEAALLLMGILYVPLLMSHMILLRGLPHGVQWIFLLLVTVMSGDSAAYYVGSNIGKTKLYPIVSPNKSVEGSIGGLLGSIIGALLVKLGFFPELTFGDCVVAALLLGGFGQLGDLFESLLKRSCGVKDSGTIVPGHGGILDRLDSILFAAPAAFYYAWFIF